MSNISIVLGTKGETLVRLKDLLTSAEVLPIELFTIEEWQTKPEAVLKKLRDADWFNRALIVRSSALVEDSASHSHAGEFLSVPGVKGEAATVEAIHQVIASYGTPTPRDQVLVQPQLEGVKLSGVAFSKDPGSQSPYRVICYEVGTDTSAVTAGKKTALKTQYCLKGHEHRLPPQLQGIASLLGELEILTGNDALDIEFALTEHTLYLFQCRPLIMECVGDGIALENALHSTHRKIEELSRPHPYLLGKTTLFGVMPDWNPAEIIGLKPRTLSLTLYRELITSGIWAYQRDKYGYRNLRSFPLMVDFWGLPYIDVRVSFNSFVPKTLSDGLGSKLVDFYLQALEDAPTLHDKVEFEIALTCYTLDINKRLDGIRRAGFTDAECDTIRHSLRELTDGIIHHDTGLWRKDIGKIRILESRIPTILDSGLDDLSRIYWLLEDCKRYGTLPFAGLARAGFIAVQMLRSLVTEEVLNEEDYERFFQSIETVSSQMVRDFHLMEKNAFLARYGHLRPGTYDLLSDRYDQAPERYFDWSKRDPAAAKAQTPFSLELGKLKKLEKLLSSHGLPYSALDFLEFIRAAIEGREYSKFVFTRALSEAMELVAKLGETNGVSRDDISYVDIHSILGLYASADSTKEVLESSVLAGKARFAVTRNFRLPPLVASPDAIYCFELPCSQPNFVTRKRVSGSVVRLDKNTTDFEGRIIFIPSADPGYDWIFSKNIRGLVTMFGGANSHMAIRAGELGIAAVIGAGENLYTSWSESEIVELDCENQKVQTLR